MDANHLIADQMEACLCQVCESAELKITTLSKQNEVALNAYTTTLAKMNEVIVAQKSFMTNHLPTLDIVEALELQVAELTKQNAELNKRCEKFASSEMDQCSHINCYNFVLSKVQESRIAQENQAEAQDELDTTDYELYVEMYDLEAMD